MKKNLIKLGSPNFVINYNDDEEIGGILIGYQGKEDTDYEITHFVQLPNVSKQDKKYNYQLPNVFKCFLKILPHLLMGREVIGEWHSHCTNITHPSKQDEKTIFKKVKIKGRYLLGIVCNKQVRIYRYNLSTMNIKDETLSTWRKNLKKGIEREAG